MLGGKADAAGSPIFRRLFIRPLLVAVTVSAWVVLLVLAQRLHPHLRWPIWALGVAAAMAWLIRFERTTGYRIDDVQRPLGQWERIGRAIRSSDFWIELLAAWLNVVATIAVVGLVLRGLRHLAPMQ